MVAQVSETMAHFPPPPSHAASISPHKPIALSFQSPRKIHQPTITSQPINTDTHLCILDKPINSTTYASILDSCTCPNLGEQLHAHTIKSGFHGHEFVETKLLQMYGRCGCVNNASLLFDAMPLRNLYSWTAILNVHLDRGLFDDAVSIFQQLLFDDIGLDFFLFPVVFKVCSGIGMVELGEQLHGMAIKYQFVSNIYVGNALIDMYGKCGYLGDAKKVLQNMHERDRVSWNSMLTACAANGMVYEALEFLERMSLVDSFSPNLVSWSAVIGGFAQNGYDKEAIEMLARMQAEGQKPNARTLASVLPACAKLHKLDLGRELHGYIMRYGFMSNSFVVNGLVDLYRRCGDMRTALKIFSWFSEKNTVSYNTMIVGYCENGEISRAREFFDQMDAAGIKKDIISWNSMLSGFVDNFMYEEALSMFSDLLMVEELESDSFTLGSVLTACADMASLRQGKEIHSYAIAKGLHCNTFVGGALVEMYCKCQDLEAAQMAFDEITENDTATWNALVSGYARCNQIESMQDLLQKMKRDGYEPNIYTWNGIIAGHVENGHHDMAMQLFSELQASDMKPDIYTIGIILPTCSRLITLERGKQIHAVSVRCGYDSHVHIGAALVDMYSKCGSIKYATFAYNRIANPNLVSQNAMLTAYATHGLGEEGVDFFQRMLAMGVRPDHVTFLSVLSACVHAGSVEKGHEFFDLMGYYGLKPTLKHYTCMVDLLSRAGQLHKAYEFIKNMPMEPDSVLWGALLGGCVIHGNVGLGEIAAKRLMELEPSDSGNHVLLANLYAFAGRWSDLARTRQLMKDGGIQKSPGCSWIEDKDEIHAFLASDRSHMRTDEIYATLNTLNLHMKRDPVISQ
ncbi:pentatricopeptide repeat-containing protein At2g13600-like [Tripterygium wilfordii]|uniref:pentatricopeptide repeat-containing protein At2g13600-like n=1 Tax=Tripterygium wilfordii TaxID=458696 RepID=UPI0018F82BD0|nr:pentatricopeptide repeat-containing protein At2g13600-like [Tripterygium wilfordii]